MTSELLKYICEPFTGNALHLEDPGYCDNGNIVSGKLVSETGNVYPIIRGIPRFVASESLVRSVASFGDEWNYFNFTDFKEYWVNHTINNTFGTLEVFEDKVVVDAGGGSGAQTLWMLEAGARHVIMLDLSNSVDDVVQRNLKSSGYNNYDVIQCSIDAPPIRNQSVEGIVYCHNVIQHTFSVEATAKALYSLVAPGGEFVFNVYPTNDEGFIRWIRFHLVYKSLRAILSRLPFWIILSYAKGMAFLREVPLIGILFEKSGFLVRGDASKVGANNAWKSFCHRINMTTLVTYDYFGFHGFQHHKSKVEVMKLLAELQPDSKMILNLEKYFSRPSPTGCAVRVLR